MLDTAYGELYAAWRSPRSSPGIGARSASSPSAIGTSIADTPGCCRLPAPRPAIGPHASLKYEAELRPLDKLGLSDVEMDATLTLVLTHVEGCAGSGCLSTHPKRYRHDRCRMVGHARTTSEKIIDLTHFPVAARGDSRRSRIPGSLQPGTCI